MGAEAHRVSSAISRQSNAKTKTVICRRRRADNLVNQTSFGGKIGSKGGNGKDGFCALRDCFAYPIYQAMLSRHD
jgi:hypothetical protein